MRRQLARQSHNLLFVVKFGRSVILLFLCMRDYFVVKGFNAAPHVLPPMSLYCQKILTSFLPTSENKRYWF